MNEIENQDTNIQGQESQSGPFTQLQEEKNSASESGDLLLGKFKSQEELARAYTELEKKLGDRQENSQEDVGSEDPIGSPVDREAESYVPGLTSGELFDIESEYLSSGQLSAEAYTKLQEKGYPQPVVDAYIRGQVARVDSLLEPYGGRDKFNEMGQWARKSMDKSKVDHINSMLSSNNDHYMNMALRELHSAYTAENGQDPKLVKGTTSGGISGDVYTHDGEVMRDMQDPRYWDDANPKFRREVQAKLARSNKHGTIKK